MRLGLRLAGIGVLLLAVALPSVLLTWRLVGPGWMALSSAWWLALLLWWRYGRRRKRDAAAGVAAENEARDPWATSGGLA